MIKPHTWPDYTMVFSVDGRETEEYLICRDIRHEKKGFRIIPYIRESYAEHWDFNWTETYLFYENLNDFYAELEKNDFSEGKKNF